MCSPRLDGAVALFYANEKFFDHPRWMRVCLGIVVVVMFALAALTAQSLFSQIIHWL